MLMELLFAHSGHLHQEESVELPATNNEPSSTVDKQLETKPQISPEEQKTFNFQDTVQEKQPSLTNPKTATLEPTPQNLVSFVGEFLFVLLLASPFLLIVFKRWFHKQNKLSTK